MAADDPADRGLCRVCLLPDPAGAHRHRECSPPSRGRTVSHRGDRRRLDAMRAAMEEIAAADADGHALRSRVAMHRIAREAIAADDEAQDNASRADDTVDAFDPADPHHPYDLDIDAEDGRPALGEAWADDHRDEVRRRPAGEVVYRILGGDGYGYGGVRVRRSSDGREATMAVTKLIDMDVIDVAWLDAGQRERIGLPA